MHPELHSSIYLLEEPNLVTRRLLLHCFNVSLGWEGWGWMGWGEIPRPCHDQLCAYLELIAFEQVEVQMLQLLV